MESLELEKKIEGYTQECLSKTSLTEHELKKFFEAFLSSVFLDSGKQPRFESYCKRYSRYETELTDYTQKCLDLFGVDLHKVVIQKPDSVDLKVKQLTEWIHVLSTLPFSSALNPILAKIQKVDWTQQKILEKLVEMNAVYVIKQLTYGVDLFNRIKRKQPVSMEMLLPLYTSCSDYLDTLVATVEGQGESIHLATRDLILESLKYMTDKIDSYYNFMVERFKVIPNDQLERMYKHSLSTKVNLTTLLTEYTMTPMTPAARENATRIKRLIDTLHKNYEKVIDMEKKWIKTIRGDNRIIEALKDYLNGYKVDDISLITMILMSINHLKGDLNVVVPVRRSVSSNIPRLAANESEKADEPKEPATETVAEMSKEPVTETVKEPVTEPSKETVNEPVTETVKEPVKEPSKEPVEESKEPVIEKPEKSGLTWGDTFSKVFGNTNTTDTEKEPSKEPPKEPSKEPSVPIFSTALEKFRGLFQPNVEVQDNSRQDKSRQEKSAQDKIRTIREKAAQEKIQAMREKVMQDKALQYKALEEKMRKERNVLDKKLQAERAVSKAALNEAYQKLKERGEFSKEQETKLETVSKENYHKIAASLKARFASMEKELQEKHDKDVADNQSKIEIEIEKVKTQQRQLQQERAVDASTRSESELKERTKTLNTENLTPSGTVETVPSITPVPPVPPLQPSEVPAQQPLPEAPLPPPVPEASVAPAPPLQPSEALVAPAPPSSPLPPTEPSREPEPASSPEEQQLPEASPPLALPPEPAQSPEPSLPPAVVPHETLEKLSLALNYSKEIQAKLQLTVVEQAAKITLSNDKVSEAQDKAAAAEVKVEEITKQLKNISNSKVGSDQELNEQLAAARSRLEEAQHAAAVSQNEAYAVKKDADKRIAEIEEKLAQTQAKIVAEEAKPQLNRGNNHEAKLKELTEEFKVSLMEAERAAEAKYKEELSETELKLTQAVAETKLKFEKDLADMNNAQNQALAAEAVAREAMHAKSIAEEEVKQISIKLSELTSETDTAKETIKELKEKEQIDERKILTLKYQIAQVKQEKNTELAHFDQSKKLELAEADKGLEELTQEIKATEGLLSLSETKIIELKKELDIANVNLNETNNAMEIAKKSAKETQDKLVAAEKTYSLEITSLNEELETVRKQLTGLEEAKTAAETQAIEAKTAAATAKSESEIAQSKADAAQTDADEAKAKLLNVITQKNASNAEITKLRKNVEELDKTRAEVTAAVLRAEAAESAAKEAVLRANASNKAIKTMIEEEKRKKEEEQKADAERVIRRKAEGKERQERERLNTEKRLEAQRQLEAQRRLEAEQQLKTEQQSEAERRLEAEQREAEQQLKADQEVEKILKAFVPISRRSINRPNGNGSPFIYTRNVEDTESITPSSEEINANQKKQNVFAKVTEARYQRLVEGQDIPNTTKEETTVMKRNSTIQLEEGTSRIPLSRSQQQHRLRDEKEKVEKEKVRQEKVRIIIAELETGRNPVKEGELIERLFIEADRASGSIQTIDVRVLLLEISNRKLRFPLNNLIQKTNETIIKVATFIAKFIALSEIFVQKEIDKIYLVPSLVLDPYPATKVDCFPDTLLYYLSHYYALIVYVDAMKILYGDVARIIRDAQPESSTNTNENNFLKLKFFSDMNKRIHEKIEEMIKNVREKIKTNPYVLSTGKSREERIKSDLIQIYKAGDDLSSKIKNLEKILYDEPKDLSTTLYHKFKVTPNEENVNLVLKDIVKKDNTVPNENDNKEGVFRIFVVIKAQSASVARGYPQTKANPRQSKIPPKPKPRALEPPPPPSAGINPLTNEPPPPPQGTGRPTAKPIQEPVTSAISPVRRPLSRSKSLSLVYLSTLSPLKQENLARGTSFNLGDDSKSVSNPILSEMLIQRQDRLYQSVNRPPPPPTFLDRKLEGKLNFPLGQGSSLKSASVYNSRVKNVKSGPHSRTLRTRQSSNSVSETRKSLPRLKTMPYSRIRSLTSNNVTSTVL